MIFYVRVSLGPGGIAELSGKMEKVEHRANATQLTYGDAAFLQEQALKGWPGLNWQIERVSDTRYVVKAMIG